MSQLSKAKINLREGTIELEGTEEFVSKYLDDFKEKFLQKPILQMSNVPANEGTSSDNLSQDQEKAKIKKQKIAKKIEAEQFNIDGDSKNNIPSLSNFFNKKNPGKKAPKVIATIGYYITQLLKQAEFSEGNIEYGYKALGITTRPAHLHQIIINVKNDKQWFEDGSTTDKWKMSRIGEIFIESKLPEKKDSE